MFHEDKESTILPVLAALIFNSQNQVLIARRKEHLTNGEKWEFPGGKLRQKESPETCLTREIKEEMGVHIKVIRPFHLVNYDYKEYSILLIGYICSLETENWELKDHSQIHWSNVVELVNFDLTLPDILIADLLRKEFL